MCFDYSSYDLWCAASYEEQDLIAAESSEPLRCCECGRQITAGEKYHNVYAEEHDMCQICEDMLSDEYDSDQDPGTCEHDYGRSQDENLCWHCHSLRQAIHAIEKAEGCSDSESTPLVGTLYESVGSSEDWNDYASRAEVRGLMDEAKLLRSEAEAQRSWSLSHAPQT